MKHLIASLLLVAACNTDPLAPGAGSKPGGGTNTLLVNGSASAEPREGIVHATRPEDFETEFHIRVTLNGNQVRTGTVEIAQQELVTPLAWTDNDGGMWVGRAAGYAEVYALDVISGADEVGGVIVDGPDFHIFTAPLLGATLDSTVPNAVEWKRDDVADRASFRVTGIDRIEIVDNELYSMAPNTMEASSSEVRDAFIELRRTNSIVPAGAIPGSDFSVSVENDLQVLVQPNPAL